MRIAVVGQGYVGLPLALKLAESGCEVIGIDVNKEVVANLTQGVSHIEDVSDQQLIQQIELGRYEVASEFKKVAFVDAVLITVPTPLNGKGLPDLSLLEEAIRSIDEYVLPKTLISIESSSFPGTLRKHVIPMLDKRDSLLFVSAPERVDPLNPNWNQRNTPRVLGPVDEVSAQKAKEIYSLICDDLIMVSSPEVAEASKMLENAFRLVNIAFINEISNALTLLKIDAMEVIDAASTKPFGFMKFLPGIGAGGHCIPVDPVYLNNFFEQNGYSSTILNHSINSNNTQKEFVVGQISEFFRESKKNLLVGLTYKAGVCDLRESPAAEILKILWEKKIEVDWFDSLVSSFQGVERSKLSSDYERIVILVDQPKEIIDFLSGSKAKILDFTGTKRSGEILSFFRGGHDKI